MRNLNKKRKIFKTIATREYKSRVEKLASVKSVSTNERNHWRPYKEEKIIELPLTHSLQPNMEMLIRNDVILPTCPN